MKRRDFLKTGAVLALAPMTTGTRAAVRPANEFSLMARPGQANLVGQGNPTTEVWQYGGTVPGPVLRVPQGKPVRIRFDNQLPQPSTMHWHGIRLANAMDGVPKLIQKEVQSGKQFLYEFTPPDAGTYWYHPHSRTWEQMARGLYGVIIVNEDKPPLVDRDLVWAVDDWLLNEQAGIEERSLGAMHDWAHGGRQGNWITINGEPEPEVIVHGGERLRLRLVNVANARIMDLRFKGVEAHTIALDGQPVAPEVLPEGRVTLAPGQRADLMIDITGKPGQRFAVEYVTRRGGVKIAHLVVSNKTVRKHLLTSSIELPPNPADVALDLKRMKTFELKMEGGAMGGLREAFYKDRVMPIRELVQHKQVWALNGQAGMTRKPLFRVRRGQVTAIRIINDNSWPHAMHLHGHHFKVLQEGSNPLAGPWHDTFLIGAGETRTIVFRADNPGRWLLHCHMVEHTAAGMVTWVHVR